MFYTVYKITNTLDNKIYIGKHQTLNLEDTYMGSGKLISRSIKKHGIENFKKEILHIFDNEDDMNAKEAELVDEEFCLREDTYNICPGGKGGWGYINSSGKRNGVENWTPEQKSRAAKIANSSPIKQTKEFKEKRAKSISNGLKVRYSKHAHPWVGKTHTKETLVKLRKSKNVGETNSQFGTMWITNGESAKKIKKTDDIPTGWRRGRK